MESSSAPVNALPWSSTAWRVRLADVLRTLRWPVFVYVSSRLLVLAVAIADGLYHHHTLGRELANWDGEWYGLLAYRGYPHYIPLKTSTLGFFPLYPLVIRQVAGVLSHFGYPDGFLSLIHLSGVIVSVIGGLVAAVLVQRLATGWWGAAAGRRAVALFCLFPGSVVFSMVYAEGLMLPLVMGCLLALQGRRWLLAGILAGLATATEPQGVVLIVVCCVSAGRELRRSGWGSRAGRRSLLAPALSVTGIAAFALYLWVHTGTPFAMAIVQHRAWHEGFDLFALVGQVQRLIFRIQHHISPRQYGTPIGALAGAAVLVALLVLMFKRRRSLPLEAWTWTLGIVLISLCTAHLPPNSRMLITAFPAVLILATYFEGRRFWVLQTVNVLLLIATAWFVFVFPRALPP
jgi:Gpi18-like mannosyltransferase